MFNRYSGSRKEIFIRFFFDFIYKLGNVSMWVLGVYTINIYK